MVIWYRFSPCNQSILMPVILSAKIQKIGLIYSGPKKIRSNLTAKIQAEKMESEFEKYF